jgi:hypothetical protein
MELRDSPRKYGTTLLSEADAAGAFHVDLISNLQQSPFTDVEVTD